MANAALGPHHITWYRKNPDTSLNRYNKRGRRKTRLAALAV